MANKFKIGDKVVCINGSGWEHSRVTEGSAYTIVGDVAEGENNRLWEDYANDWPDDFEICNPEEDKHSHYFKDCPYDKIDVYRILYLWKVSDPCLQHLVKKALCAGERGHKDFRRDLQDIIDTAQRRIDMLDEDKSFNE